MATTWRAAMTLWAVWWSVSSLQDRPRPRTGGVCSVPSARLWSSGTVCDPVPSVTVSLPPHSRSHDPHSVEEGSVDRLNDRASDERNCSDVNKQWVLKITQVLLWASFKNTDCWWSVFLATQQSILSSSRWSSAITEDLQNFVIGSGWDQPDLFSSSSYSFSFSSSSSFSYTCSFSSFFCFFSSSPSLPTHLLPPSPLLPAVIGGDVASINQLMDVSVALSSTSRLHLCDY